MKSHLIIISLVAFIIGAAESFAPPSLAATSSLPSSSSSAFPSSTNLPQLSSAIYNSSSKSKALSLKTRRRHINTISSSIRSSSTALNALSFLDEETTQKLIVLSFEKVIDAGIPAIFFILTTWWFLTQIRNGSERSAGRRGGRSGGGSGGGMMRMMGGGGKGSGSGRRSSQRGRGSRRMMDEIDDFGGGRPLGPVEELYDDIYDDLSGPDPQNNLPPLLKLFSGPSRGGVGVGSSGIERPTSKLNIGIPKQTYLRVTKLNSKYDSYRYSMIKAMKGKAFAASELRARGFEDALWRALGITNGAGGDDHNSNRITDGLTSSEGTALIQLERDFLSAGSELVREVSELTRAITNAAVLLEMEEMGVEAGVLDAIIDVEVVNGTDAASSTTSTTNNGAKDSGMVVAANSEKEDKKDKPKKIEKQSDIMRAVKEVEALNTEILLLELDFIQSIVEILGANRADALRTTVVGNMLSGEAGMLLKTLKERPLATVLSALNGENHDVDGNQNRRKNLFVTRFPGDVTASQLNELREEVTGILRSAQPGDEALLVLQSGGGTVTGYGLAAAQLQRFKAKGMKLTVCVEQVAASGGYMMCCTADRIVASPFAVLGSIGVISEVPNAYERLKQEGIEFQTITAGKYKRTVTPTKKITKEDIKKSEEDIAEIFNLFKSFVKNQRPQLDIESVATGETWFGEDALARGLCDELGTADDVLLDFVDNGYDVYEVVYDPPPVGASGLFTGLPSRRSSGISSMDTTADGGWRGVFKSLVRGVVSEVKDEIVSELSSTMNEMNSIERRYMAQDDSADRIKL